MVEQNQVALLADSIRVTPGLRHRWSPAAWALVGWILMGLPLSQTFAVDLPSKTVVTLQGSFVSFDPPTNIVTLKPAVGTQMTLVIADSKDRALLQLTRVGDVLITEVDSLSNPTAIVKIETAKRPVGRSVRILAFGGSALLFLMITMMASLGRPLRFLVGMDNRYSNSQCQLAIWFGVVAIAYTGMLALRVVIIGWDFLGGIGITENLAAVTGLSALSFGGAKAITSQKVDAVAVAGLPPLKTPAAKSNLMTDLFTNDKNQADLGDFQMILITVTAATTFLLSAVHGAGLLLVSHAITLPDIDSTLLAIFGIGQGAYLGKKAAMKAGDG